MLYYSEYLSEKLKNIKENKKFLQTSVENLIADKPEYKLYRTQTNFILIETEKAKEIYDFLLSKKILIRNLDSRLLRITSGSSEENKRLIECFGEYINSVNLHKQGG